ncbi:hypothetical protein B0H19DRAFT_1367498 [Mycena capillaripes]|nr:hypothetical protein B0H19DRAFT_1367498 [Mycena capillaripes]
MAGHFEFNVDILLRDLEMIRLVSAAGLVILLYDHLLSLSDEVRFIWPAKFTSSKIAFLVMRYTVPLQMIIHTIQLAGLSDVHFSDTVLLRVWVLWDRNRTFIVCTFLIFLATNMVFLALAWITLVRMIPGLHIATNLPGCTINNALSTFRVLWLPGLLFQFFMLLAMGWKVATRLQTFSILRRDGFLYFLFLFGINLINTMIVLFARPTLLFVTIFFMWSFTTTATCRMILSLRRSAHYARMNEGIESADSSDEYPHDARQPTTRLEFAAIHEQSSSSIRTDAF